MTGEKFKSFFEELGFTGVQVVLSSGNIIFESSSTNRDRLSEQIEKALPQKLGFERSVILRSQADLQSIIDSDPFEGSEQLHNRGTYLLITFFRRPLPMPFKLPHTPEDKPYVILGSLENAVYGSVDLSGNNTPNYMTWLEKQFGKDITSRTPKTIRLILSRMNKS
jgi:uncharacterized protein (DUF1697 family)